MAIMPDKQMVKTTTAESVDFKYNETEGVKKVPHPRLSLPRRGGVELSKVPARILIAELRTRGYRGKLEYVQEVVI